MRSIRVWDLPTRLFHWLLASAVLGSFVSVNIGGNAMVWHGRFGYLVLSLLLFRVVWGFVGPIHVRFSRFVKGPRAVLAFITGQQPQQPGHSPLGALSVMAILFFFLAQAMTGLFTSDDILFDGPLAKHVSSATVQLMGRLHRLNEWVLMSLVAVHVLAIVFYYAVKKRNLTRAMITGDSQETTSGAPSPAARDDAPMRARALVVFALAALLVGYLSR